MLFVADFVQQIRKIVLFAADLVKRLLQVMFSKAMLFCCRFC